MNSRHNDALNVDVMITVQFGEETSLTLMVKVGLLVGWKINVSFQHKYGYIRDKRSRVNQRLGVKP